MVKSLTILFTPNNGVGHVNACIGVAEVLHESGHRIVFAVSEQWRGKLSAYGFEEELISDPETHRDHSVDHAKHCTKTMIKMGATSALTPIEEMKTHANHGFTHMTHMINLTKKTDGLMAEIINRWKPHVIVIDNCLDNYFMPPSILKSGIPWVMLWSANPLGIHNANNENVPPMGFGLPCDDRKDWAEADALRRQRMRTFLDAYNAWMDESGCEKLESETQWAPRSPYLNIYDYPEEIDYVDDLPKNYQRFDSFICTDKTSQFEVPAKLSDRPGKLIYFSFGSTGSGDVHLMKRLISILSKSPHKFIVSKGQLHDQYELADNMWGEKTVSQTKVLSIVDLVITHGGNNSLTETFYFGKPMIVMPFFGDQYDNAQRVHETGYGIRLDPYTCSETELLDAIENLLNDRKLETKMNEISKRIQTSNKLRGVVDMIEKLAKRD